MRKKAVLFIFILTAAAQLLLSISSVLHKEQVLAEGELFRFRTVAVDPDDSFRGKYIALYYDLSVHVKDKERYQEGEDIYVIVERGDDSFAVFTGISETKPSKDYLKLRIDYIWGDELYFMIPFDRYYIDEDIAEVVEEAYWNVFDEDDCYVDVRIKNGHAVLENWFINGTPVTEYLES